MGYLIGVSDQSVVVPKKLTPVTSYDITFARDRVAVRGPDSLVPVIKAMGIRELEVEHFFVLALNARNQLIRAKLISTGSVDTCLVHPRECVHPLIESRAARWICIHNHPSGEPSPSAADLELTKRLHGVGHLVGIELLDHIVVGDVNTSIREKNPTAFVSQSSDT